MVVLGLILILLGLLVGGYTVAAGLPGQQGSDVSLSFLGLTVETSAVVVFALGALTLLLIELGVLAMRSGARKSSRRRAELQRLRRVEAEVQTRQSAESQRNATATTAPASTPAPFARREPASETRPTTSEHTPDDRGPESPRDDATRHDLSAVRPPETGPGAPSRPAYESGPGGVGPSGDRDPGEGATRSDRS